ncbi:MAG TPA: YbjN domain-containing protein [Clostridia bacterium]|nr:YbjN domain-containing protein [Clostridia bacterium]
MNPLLHRIQQLLKDKLEVNADMEDDQLHFSGRCGPVTSRIRITADESLLTVMGHFPVFASTSKRAAACETVVLINWGLSVAHFSLDTDGEIVCIAQMVLFDGTPTDRQLARLIHRVWSCLEFYAESLIAILTAGADPALTIARAEKLRTESRRQVAAPDLSVN